MKLENMFDAIEEIQDKANVTTVFGDPVEVGDKTIIPVADVKFGFGIGFGEGPTASKEEEESETSSQGGGSGGGVTARPVAVVEISDTGVVVRPVSDEGRIALAGILTGAWAIMWIALTLRAIFGKK
jgi:uncharacterized spore protein YtfJ